MQIIGRNLLKSKMILQIHDELCFSITDHETKLIKSVMEETIPLEVKNKVDFESGPSWGTIK